MSQYIPDALRRLVAERGHHRCKYCRLSTIDSFFAFHIDHIISWKHGGATTEDNLAYASLKIPDLNHPERVIERRKMLRSGML